ncbi:MAG: hypothetical protein ABS944_03680 [Solibacillus sp.]|jgi:hypothetical protein|uniref:hypothetical protein n=1 Tax=unclassified Solibacillus TaxID=2637870 RepID=UPI0030FC6A0E
MYAIHYFENNTPALSQCLRRIPEIEEAVSLKGRKGKVVNVVQIAEDKYHVHIELEKIVKKEPLLKDNKKKR